MASAALSRRQIEGVVHLCRQAGGWVPSPGTLLAARSSLELRDAAQLLVRPRSTGQKEHGLERALRDRGEDSRKEIDDPDDQIAPVRTRKAREPIAGGEPST